MEELQEIYLEAKFYGLGSLAQHIQIAMTKLEAVEVQQPLHTIARVMMERL